MNPATLTMQTALDAIPPQFPLATMITPFLDGDHWQSGAGWIGALPVNDRDRQRALADIANAFVFQDVLGKGRERHTYGVIGREPRWDVLQGEMPVGDFLTPWWDARRMSLVLLDVVRFLLRDDRVVLRLSLPTVPQGGDLALPWGQDVGASLDALAIQVLPASSATVLRDACAIPYCGIAQFTDGTHTIVELSYIEGDATVLRLLMGDTVRETRYQLGRRLLHYELTRDAFFSLAGVQLQKALNLAYTQMLRNVNLAGSRERWALNAQPPGQWVDALVTDVGAVQVAGVWKRYQVYPAAVGPAAITYLQGAEVRDDQGNLTGYANPSINFVEPIGTDTFEHTIAVFKRALYEEMDQLHVLMADDATASGRSRIEARAEFVQSLRATAQAVEAACRWLLETAYVWAHDLAGQSLPDVRAEVACRLSVGVLSPNEMQAVSQLVSSGHLSLETALTMFGIDDPDAELLRLQAAQQPRAMQEVPVFQEVLAHASA